MEQNGTVHDLVAKNLKIDTDENVFEIDGRSFATECDNFVLVFTPYGFDLFIDVDLNEISKIGGLTCYEN